MGKYKSVAEIQKEFGDKIAEAEDGAKPGLEAQMWRQIAEFNAGQVHDRDVQAWRAEAVNKFPRARAEEVRGETLEELLAAAEASHTHVETALQGERERIEKEVRESVGAGLYGPGATGGTGGPPPTTGERTPDDKRYEEIMQKVKAGRGSVSEDDYNFVTEYALRPVSSRVDTSWVLELAAQRGIQIRNIEEIKA